MKARWLKPLYRLSAPAAFYRFSGRMLPWLAIAALFVTGAGWYAGLFVAPADYQQKDAFRIIYVHVPAAWMSLFVYGIMTLFALGALIWRIRLAELALIGSLPIGMTFTLITLATGSIWGKPMWGTWWIWDARLTSELLLLFVYLGIGAIWRATPDPREGARRAALLTLIGTINLPIIHYSVVWWNTLHQGVTVSLLGPDAIHPDMLWPLLVAAAGFKLIYATMLLWHMRILMMEQENPHGWLARAVFVEVVEKKAEK